MNTQRLTVAEANLAVLAELARLETRRRTDLEPATDPEAQAAALAQRSLAEFVRQAWPLVSPGRALVWNWHLDEVCAVLEAITRGDIRALPNSDAKRVILLLPPGSMKSLLVSVFWPSWEWASDPGLRYLTFTYSGANAMRDALHVRSLLFSDWYRRHYEARIAADQAAKTRFSTTAGGWRISSSIQGVGTGEHPDRIIIDDPIKAGESLSETRLETVRFWYDRTVSTRMANKPAQVVVMQRLHMGDLVGHLLKQPEGWDVVTFPMRFVPERADARDQRTEPRELLWPAMFPEEEVRRQELSLGPFGTAGQHQQNPVPEGGGLCKREWFRYCGTPPSSARRCRGWDTGGTEGGGDYTVGTKLSELAGSVYVEHVLRGQWGPNGVDANIKAMAVRDGKQCAIREEREGGSAGIAVIASRARSLAGYDYAGVPTSGDKMVRFKPFRAQLEAGNVYLVQTGDPVQDAWIEPYITELCALPVGVHDDQADSTSCAYNALIEEPVYTEATWGRAR